MTGSFSTTTMTSLLVTIVLIWTGCGPQAGTGRERPISAKASQASSSPDQIFSDSGEPQATPGTEKEVREAVRRVFGNDVVLGGHERATFVVGDFNGDQCPDLAVAVIATEGKLDDLNNTLANWIVQDPRHAYVPPKTQTVIVPPPMAQMRTIRSGEALLAVIHGYGTEGWRNPMARQAYLLRSAAGQSIHVAEPSPALLRDFGVFPSGAT